VTLKKHFLALRGTASFDVFCVKNRCARLGGSLSQEPLPPKIAGSLCVEGREITHAQKRNPGTDLNKIVRGGISPRRNHLNNFWRPLVKGFLCGGGQISPFPADFYRRPYNTFALPCECVMRRSQFFKLQFAIIRQLDC